MERLRIHVSAEDIAAAQRNTSVRCAVAVAVARELPEAKRIEVDIQAIRFTLGGERMIWQTPNKVLRYIVDFDFGERIEPFTFEARTRIEPRVRQRTAAGRALDQQRTRRRRAAQKVEQLEQAGPAAAAELPAAREQLEVEQRQLEAARAATAGKPRQTTRKGQTLPARRRTREFGVRSLRLEAVRDA